jgi:predicted nucleic acid-binding protein
MGEVVRSEIEKASDCFTCSISLAEVASFGLRHGMTNTIILSGIHRISEASAIVEIDANMAVEGASATDELRRLAKKRCTPLPGLSDGLILATARRTNSKLLTGDAHFRGLPETLWLDGAI